MKITKKDLADIIGNAVKAETKGMQDQMTDIEKRQPNLIDGHPEDAAKKDESVKKVSKVKYTVKRPNKDGVPEDEFSFVRFINAQRTHSFDGAPFEKWALDQSVRKDSPITSGSSSGGYWIGAEFLPQEFIEYYGAAQVCRAAGCRVLPCTGTPVNIPKITAGVTTYWVAENGSITKTDTTPGQLQLSPKLAVARSQISKTLFITSSGAAENILRQDMGTALGRTIDLGILEGTGASNQPTGMANTSSINTVAASSGAITVALLRDMELDLQTSNVRFVKPAFIMHPRTWHAVSEIIKATTARDFIFAVDKQPGEAVPRSIFGYPVYLSTQVSITNGTAGNEANVFLADMDDVILAEWGGIEIEATDTGGDAWAEYAVEVRAVAQVDVGIRNAGSVCLISDTTS